MLYQKKNILSINIWLELCIQLLNIEIWKNWVHLIRDVIITIKRYLWFWILGKKKLSWIAWYQLFVFEYYRIQICARQFVVIRNQRNQCISLLRVGFSSKEFTPGKSSDQAWPWKYNGKQKKEKSLFMNFLSWDTKNN